MQCLSELHAYLTLSVKSPDEAAALLQANRHRFVGNPARVDFLASAERDLGGDEAANRIVDEAIASGSNDWNLYYRRGTDIAKQGKPREALAVFRKYPGLRDANTASRARSGRETVSRRIRLPQDSRCEQ